MKNINFLFEHLTFLVVKFSMYLNRRVFVMTGHIIVWTGGRQLNQTVRD